MSRRLARLLARQRFPRYRAAFGYGSAVIPQRSTAAPALVDAVLCVDDARAWHAANVLRNPAHYSWLKTLGPAAIATALAEKEISSNIVAAYHHDHVFVPWDRRDEAMDVLRNL